MEHKYGLGRYDVYEQQGSTLCPGESGGKDFYIRWFDRNNGSLIKQIKCQCQHDHVLTTCICEHPLDLDVIIETCDDCRKIRSYKMNTGEIGNIYTESAPVL